jgi:hypothetical protein
MPRHHSLTHGNVSLEPHISDGTYQGTCFWPCAERECPRPPTWMALIPVFLIFTQLKGNYSWPSLQVWDN